MFIQAGWPKSAAVRELATKIRARVKQGEEEGNVFVFAELKKYIVRSIVI